MPHLEHPPKLRFRLITGSISGTGIANQAPPQVQVKLNETWRQGDLPDSATYTGAASVHQKTVDGEIILYGAFSIAYPIQEHANTQLTFTAALNPPNAEYTLVPTSESVPVALESRIDLFITARGLKP